MKKKTKKKKKQQKNADSQQILAVFSAATDSEIIIQILHGKGHVKFWTELSS